METTFTLQEHLKQFTGTEEYYKHTLGNMKLLLTDGCHFVREQCGAYWLFDLILSHQLSAKVRLEPFQVWNLLNKGKHWLVTCDDGNGRIIVKQQIEYSDFPLDSFVIWVEEGVALLPSEH